MYERVELEDGKCPDCGGDKFYEGPSGGACVNICCMRCLSAFNIGASKFAERIPNTHFVQGGAKPQELPLTREQPTTEESTIDRVLGWLGLR